MLVGCFDCIEVRWEMYVSGSEYIRGKYSIETNNE